MTNHRIVWKMPNGEIEVTTPAPKGRRENEKHEDWIERVAIKAKPKGATRMKDCMAEDLPSREFRHKWRHNGNEIFVDDNVADLIIEPTIEERITALESK